jgi:hypothetical protein
MSGGVSKARDASFLFQECYGGGMLDDIRGVMGNTVRWLGASASTATELSYGSEHPPIGNTWTYALNPALQPAVDQPLLAAVATAAANDPARSYPTPETGQWMHGNGGETIRLQDRCAIRHYAILWAGYTSANTTWWPLPPRIDYNLRHYFDIQRIRDSLIANWSAAGGLYDITILYGDGIHRGDGQALPPEWHAQAATRDALAAAITRVGSLISAADQFVFYASDHGSLSHDLQNGPQSLPGNGGQLVTRFSIAADELQTLANQPTNGQAITVSYDGPLDSDASVAVRVNDRTLGYLVRAGTTVDLNVPNALLSTSNEVRLQSLNSQAIAITGLSFWDGPIESVPMPVPSPSPTAIPTPCSVQFTDVPASQPFHDFVQVLACRGIIGGYADGSFRPYNNVTRGQVTKFVVNAAALNDPIPVTQQTFADVPASYPFWLYIERLAGRVYISGYTCGGPGEPCDSQARPYFRPGANLTRGQLSKIVANTGGYSEAVSGQLFEDVPATSPFYAYIERMALHNVINGYICGASPAGSCVQPGNRPYFAPGNNVTRGQTAKIVANTFYPGAPTP